MRLQWVLKCVTPSRALTAVCRMADDSHGACNTLHARTNVPVTGHMHVSYHLKNASASVLQKDV